MLKCWDPDETLLSLIEPNGFWEDRKTALFFWDGERPLRHQKKISYKTLRDMSLKFASSLSRLGIMPKDRVALLLPNSPQFVIAYFGILLAGAIAVPLNPLYTAHEVSKILKDSGAGIIVAWDKLYSLISDLEKEISASWRIKNIIITGAEDALPALKRFFYKIKAKRNNDLFNFQDCKKNVKSFSELIKNAPATSWMPDVQADAGRPFNKNDIAVLLYTSGTTSDPKGVAHTHESLLANARSLAFSYPELSHIPLTKTPVFLAAAPYFHIMGLATMLHLPLLLKAKIVLLPRPLAEAIIAGASFTKSSVFIGVPRMFGSMLAVFKTKSGMFDLSSLDICISGAVEMPEDLKNDFEKTFGKEIYIGYGMSETGITHCQRRDLGKPGSVGALFPGVEQKILNPDSSGTGEILIRGRGTMLGYWTSGIGIDQEKTSKSIDAEKWFHTGDLGRIDPDGVLFFAGRLKDMIKGLGGENIYPAEIERVLLAHPLISEAAIVGIKDKKWGEKIKAFLVLKESASAQNFTEKDILDHCRKKLAPFKIPHEIECIPELPKNFTGKVLKKELIK